VADSAAGWQTVSHALIRCNGARFFAPLGSSKRRFSSATGLLLLVRKSLDFDMPPEFMSAPILQTPEPLLPLSFHLDLAIHRR
jgi:hypothetical protein